MLDLQNVLHVMLSRFSLKMAHLKKILEEEEEKAIWESLSKGVHGKAMEEAEEGGEAAAKQFAKLEAAMVVDIVLLES